MRTARLEQRVPDRNGRWPGPSGGPAPTRVTPGATARPGPSTPAECRWCAFPARAWLRAPFYFCVQLTVCRLQPAGNVLCHFGETKTFQEFKQECDAHANCVGFSYTAPK